MTSITFDTLAYSKKLTKLGFTQEQAEGFARLAREQNEVNNAELQKLKAEIVEGVQAKLNTRDKPDDSERSKLATKSDVADVRLEVGKVRGEVEKVCGEIEKLRGETKSRETRLILWVGGNWYSIHRPCWCHGQGLWLAWLLTGTKLQFTGSLRRAFLLF